MTAILYDFSSYKDKKAEQKKEEKKAYPVEANEVDWIRNLVEDYRS